MEKVEVRIEGVTPLLMHRFPTMEEDSESTPKTRSQRIDDVEASLYTDENGNLVQPSIHLIGAMKRAGAKFQIPGQGKLTYKNLMGSGAVFIDPDMIPHEIQDWVVDRRDVVVQRSRITRSRPKLDKWALSFVMEYDEEDIVKSTLLQILEYAGKRVGIGDFRPDKGGPFGKFMVTKFESVNGKKK